MQIRWTLRQIAGAALIAFAAGLLGLWTMAKQGAFQETSIPVDVEKVFQAQDVSTLSLTAETSQVTVIGTDTDQLTVHLTGSAIKQDAPEVKIEGEPDGNGVLQLQIRTGRHSNFGLNVNRIAADIMNGFAARTKIEIQLPKKIFNLIKLQTDTGDMTVEPVTARTLSLQTDTGDIKLEGYSGNSLDAQADTGDIILRNVTGELNARTDTGDIAADLKSLKQAVTVSSDTGDIRISTHGAAGAGLDFRTDTGSVRAHADQGTINFEVKEKHRLRGTLGTGHPQVKATADTGDITFEAK